MMELEACSCDWGDFETPEFHRVTLPRARRKHRCVECGESIEPGQQYERIAGKWDGTVDTYKTCLPCAWIRRDYGGCCYYGGLREAIDESLGFDYIGDQADDDEESEG